MNKLDVGKLKRGMKVSVCDRKGVVCGVHEPEWRDHKTGAQCKELQGADIRIDGTICYYHADKISM